MVQLEKTLIGHLVFEHEYNIIFLEVMVSFITTSNASASASASASTVLKLIGFRFNTATSASTFLMSQMASNKV